MAKNDRLLLDGIIDDRVSIRLPSIKRDEVFEYLAFEQLLKEYDLSPEDILSGRVDGRQDGGIDGFFVLVNGNLLQDPDSFQWPRTNSELRLILVTCKHHDTFKQATLDALIATVSEFLNLAVEDSELKGLYSELLLQARNKFKFAYRKLSPKLASFYIDFYYVSRGEIFALGSEVAARGDQAIEIAKNLFGQICIPTFSFVGASELVALNRKAKSFALEIPFVESLAQGERYVLLVRLMDYFTFISDDGKLRRYLFDSNVRGYMGENRVNEDIRSTLENHNSPDFWLLNNGITILASRAAIAGKRIQASDIQIVNGLQTTESIYKHFSKEANRGAVENRCVLLKIIVTESENVRDQIIRATNNQTNVEIESLHATDKIQRDIEDVLLRSGLYYERRKNVYLNQGRTLAEIVTPNYAATAAIALISRSPQAATLVAVKPNYLVSRSPNFLNGIFSEETPLEAWPKIVGIFKAIDDRLSGFLESEQNVDRFIKGWRPMIAFVLVAQFVGKFSFSTRDLIAVDTADVSSERVVRVYGDLQDVVTQRGEKVQRHWWANLRNVVAACKILSTAYGIGDLESVKHPEFVIPSWYGPDARFRPLDEKFIRLVKELLPPQPWAPGAISKVLDELRVTFDPACTSQAVRGAIKFLIAEGHCLRQESGILYDVQ